jgi:hypothetical protein
MLVTLGDAILSGARGEFYHVIVAVVYTWFFASRIIPRVSSVLAGGIVLCICLLLLVGYRSDLHLGAKTRFERDIVEAMMATSDITDIEMQVKRTNTLFPYHTAVIDTIDQTQKYNFGVDWIYTLTVHTIPRRVWPQKPSMWNVGITPFDVYREVGWLRAGGAAWGLVADLYREFGIASILMWFVLGRISRRFLEKVGQEGNPINILVYVMWCVWALDMFAQSIKAILAMYLYVVLPGLLLLWWCRTQVSRSQLPGFVVRQKRTGRQVV